MDEFKRISGLLAELGRNLGFDDFDFDETDACTLVFDDEIVHLCWREAPQVLVTWAIVGAVPDDPVREAEFCRRALAANFNGRDTEGLSLATSAVEEMPARHFVVQDRREPGFFATADDLANYLGSVTRVVREFRAKIEGGGFEPNGLATETVITP